MTITQHDIIQACTASTAPGSATHHDNRGVDADSTILRPAVAGYLGRYKGQTRVHTASDLRVFLTWCTERQLDPLNAA